MPPLARYAWRIALFALAIAGTALAFPELCQRRLPTAEPEAQALGESPRPPTPPPPRPAVQPRPRDAGAPAKVADEHGLLLQIRAALASDPARAEALARESR